MISPEELKDLKQRYEEFGSSLPDSFLANLFTKGQALLKQLYQDELLLLLQNISNKLARPSKLFINPDIFAQDPTTKQNIGNFLKDPHYQHAFSVILVNDHYRILMLTKNTANADSQEEGEPIKLTAKIIDHREVNAEDESFPKIQSDIFESIVNEINDTIEKSKELSSKFELTADLENPNNVLFKHEQPASDDITCGYRILRDAALLVKLSNHDSKKLSDPIEVLTQHEVAKDNPIEYVTHEIIGIETSYKPTDSFIAQEYEAIYNKYEEIDFIEHSTDNPIVDDDIYQELNKKVVDKNKLDYMIADAYQKRLMKFPNSSEQDQYKQALLDLQYILERSGSTPKP